MCPGRGYRRASSSSSFGIGLSAHLFYLSSFTNPRGDITSGDSLSRYPLLSRRLDSIRTLVLPSSTIKPRLITTCQSYTYRDAYSAAMYNHALRWYVPLSVLLDAHLYILLFAHAVYRRCDTRVSGRMYIHTVARYLRGLFLYFLHCHRYHRTFENNHHELFIRYV